MSASLNPIVLLVISRFNLRIYCTDCGTCHHAKTNAQPFSIFCFAIPRCFCEFPRAEACHHQPDLPSAPTLRAFARIKSLLHRHPPGYPVQYVVLVLLSNTTGEEHNNDVVPRVLCTITLHMVTSSSNHLFVLRKFFFSPVNPIKRSCCVLSFVRHVFNMSLEEGKGCTLNSLNVRVSEIHEYMAQQQTS